MKKILFITLLIAGTILKAQKTYVPDDNFEQKLINLGYDGVLDDSVLTANINTISYLNISNSNIQNITGIEDFDDLTNLQCYNNELTNLNLSSNQKLTILNCNENLLTSLSFSNNDSLRSIHCNENLLTSIDVSNNPELERLICWNNSLTSIDISNNLSLEMLNFSGNQISNIDLSNHLNLRMINCNENSLTDLNLTNNTQLRWVQCSNNSINDIDVSNQEKLSLLDFSYNDISSIDISNNDSLKILKCSGTQLENIEIEDKLLMKQIVCSENNQLESLKVINSNNANLTMFLAINTPNLHCIQVDNVLVSDTAWVGTWFLFDSQTNFSLDCSPFFSIDEEIANLNDFYPNPVSSILNVNVKKHCIYKVYSILGKEVLQSGELEEGYNKLDLSPLATGVYMLNINTDNGITIMKRLIKR